MIGDLIINSSAPSIIFRDNSTDAKDLKQQWDANVWNIFTETTAGTDVFDQKVTEYNAGTGVGFLFSGGSAKLSWRSTGIALLGVGSYASDSAAAAGGVEKWERSPDQGFIIRL